MTASQITVPIAKEELDRLVKEVSDSKSVLAEMSALARKAADEARKTAEENKALKVQLAEALVANDLLQKSRAARPATQPKSAQTAQAGQKSQNSAAPAAVDPDNTIEAYRKCQQKNVDRLMQEHVNHLAMLSYAALLEKSISLNDPDNPIVKDPATGKHYPDFSGANAFVSAVRKRFVFPKPTHDHAFAGKFGGEGDPFDKALMVAIDPVLRDFAKRDGALAGTGKGLRDRMNNEIERLGKHISAQLESNIENSCLRLILRGELRRLLPEHPLANDKDLALAIVRNAKLSYSLTPEAKEAWDAADRVAHSTFVARVKDSPAMAAICERLGVPMLEMPAEAAADALKMLEQCSPRPASSSPKG